MLTEQSYFLRAEGDEPDREGQGLSGQRFGQRQNQGHAGGVVVGSRFGPGNDVIVAADNNQAFSLPLQFSDFWDSSTWVSMLTERVTSDDCAMA